MDRVGGKVDKVTKKEIIFQTFNKRIVSIPQNFRVIMINNQYGQHVEDIAKNTEVSKTHDHPLRWLLPR